MCQLHTKLTTFAGINRVGSLGLEQDDLRLQTDHLCEQRLLVVGEGAALSGARRPVPAPAIESAAPAPFVEALERVVGRARRSASAPRTRRRRRLPRGWSSAVSRRGEGVGGLAVECVGARVPADHLEAQPGEARLQLAGGLLERFGGDLLIRPLAAQRCLRACVPPCDRRVRRLAASGERMDLLLPRDRSSQATAAGEDGSCFQRGVQLPLSFGFGQQQHLLTAVA